MIPIWAGLGSVIGAASFRQVPLTQGVVARLARSIKPGGADSLATRSSAKQSETAIRAARAELRVASRRNSMSELVASLSHEINQPLGAILSNLARCRAFADSGESATFDGLGGV